MKKIVFTLHAASRLSERSDGFGLDLYEARKRTRETVFERNISKTKSSTRGRVYYKYFADGLSFFVICNETTRKIRISTLIIKQGRE